MIMLVSGCTSYAGIEKGEGEEYYVVKNSYLLFITIPTIDRCNPNSRGKFECKQVR